MGVVMRADAPRRSSRGVQLDPAVVRQTASRSGARIAWSASGSRRPTLVVVSGWVSHVTSDWNAGEAGRFHRFVAARRRLLRYDRPGTGLADRDGYDFSLEGEIDVLLRVLDASGDDRVALLAHGFGGPVAIAFAARFPRRVSHLVLFNTAPRILAGPDHADGMDPALSSALEQLMLAEWGIASRTMCDLLLSDSAQQRQVWLADYQRSCATGEVAAAMFRALHSYDAQHLLAGLSVPTLVLHRRSNVLLGAGNAQLIAEKVPGAELRLLDGGDAYPWGADHEEVARVVNAFLDPPGPALTMRELDVMRMVAAGLSNRAIGQRLWITEHTVARHVANVFIKLEVSSRGAAVAALRVTAVLDD